MLSKAEQELIFTLAQKLTGAHPEGSYRPEIFLTNVEKRIRETGCRGLMDYLRLANSRPDEQAHLISSLSIHTTSWFRENPHFVIFQQLLFKALETKQVFKVWSAACSTGEEVYSFALMLEEFRRINPSFDYQVLGTDIDPVSVETARRGIYSAKVLNGPVSYYKNQILVGSGNTEGYFTFTKDIRQRCEFRTQDIREPLPNSEEFHIVVCRNVLIYFAQATMEKVIRSILDHLCDGGHIILGHSEIIPHAAYGLSLKGHSVYQKGRIATPEIPMAKAEPKPAPAIPVNLNLSAPTHEVMLPVQGGGAKVLIIDDSRLARESLNLRMRQSGFSVLLAEDTAEAENILKTEAPDLMLLDLNLPGKDGSQWLTELRWRGVKTPIVIVSSAHPSETRAVMLLLEEGAQAYLEKEDVRLNPEMLTHVVHQIIQTNQQRGPQPVNFQHPKKRPLLDFQPRLILVGASTGGPMAVAAILNQLPPWTPPVVVVQHISAKFARPFSDRVADISNLKLGQIEQDAVLKPGHFYLAQDDYHLAVEAKGSELILKLDSASHMNGHRPSVDFLFFSACRFKVPTMAMLLTGMGKDGAVGLDSLHQQGVFTMAQSEEDCVVYGMPKEAIKRGAADFVGNCQEIHQVLKEILIRMTPGQIQVKPKSA